MLAAIPRGRPSDGSAANAWRGAPRSPTVLRNRVMTRIFDATVIRSCTRISFDTAAAISGMSPGASAPELAPRPRRQQPVAKFAHRQVRNRREAPPVLLIHNQPRDFVFHTSHQRSLRNVASGRSASAICAATRSSAACAENARQFVARPRR